MRLTADQIRTLHAMAEEAREAIDFLTNAAPGEPTRGRVINALHMSTKLAHRLAEELENDVHDNPPASR